MSHTPPRAPRILRTPHSPPRLWARQPPARHWLRRGGAQSWIRDPSPQFRSTTVKQPRISMIISPKSRGSRKGHTLHVEPARSAWSKIRGPWDLPTRSRHQKDLCSLASEFPAVTNLPPPPPPPHPQRGGGASRANKSPRRFQLNPPTSRH